MSGPSKAVHASSVRCVWLRVPGLRLALLVFLGLALMGRAHGQNTLDEVVRLRLTESEGPVRAAELRLRLAAPDGGLSEGAPVVARTDGAGEIPLIGFVPGPYRVEVRFAGTSQWLGPVALALDGGEAQEIDLRVERGSQGALLAVAAGPGLADLARLEVGRKAAKDGQRSQAAATGVPVALNELPLEGRQWEGIEEIGSGGQGTTLAGGSGEDAAEAPESAAEREAAETGSAASGVSFDGLPPTQNAQSTDGVSATEGFGGGPRGASGGGPRLGSSFAQGAVATVRVRPRTFSTRNGGAAGGVIAVQSRRATGGLHGGVFLQARQSAWAATNPFSEVSRYSNGSVTSRLVKPSESTTQFGGSVGLPLRASGLLGRWRTGVFGAVEGQVRTQTMVSAPKLTSFFQLTPMQTGLLANRGVSAGAVNAAVTYLNSLMGAAVVYTPRTLGFVRLDAAPSRADRLSFGVQVGRQSSPATGGGQVADGVIDRAISSIGTGEVQTEAYTAGWQHLLPVHAANDLRVQMAHELRFEAPPAASGLEPDVGPGGYAPQVAISPDGFSYGTPASLGRVAYPDESRVQMADDLAWRVGRHVLTVGGDWSRVHDRVLSATNLEGAFLYDSGVTGGHAGGLVDWITDYTFNVHAYPNGGCPSIYAAVHYFCFRSFTQSFTGAPTEFVTREFAGFVEDSVRAGPGLLVTIGSRYEYLLLPFPQRPNVALDSVLGIMDSPVVGSTASFPEDRNNFAPRISVAWRPRRGRGEPAMTVQAGYGFFYGRVPGAMIDAALADTGLPASTTSLRIVPTTETECPQVVGSGVNQGFGYPCAFLSAPGGMAGQTTSAMVFARGFRLPSVQRGTVGLERELGRHLFVRGEFATMWATQLPQSVDLNVMPSTAKVTYVLEGGAGQRGLQPDESFSVPVYTARRTGLYGPVTALVSNANATYNSGTAEVRVQNWRGVEVRASYTFSRAIDYGEQSSAAPRQDGQFDPFTDGYDKGLSSFQVPHRVAGYLTYRSEVRGGRGERAALSGWKVSAIGTASSGAPYSYTVFGGTRLTGGHESMNGSGGATYLPTVGRNTLRLPARSKVDVRVARELPVNRRTRLELRADAFNVLNSVSVSRVETRAFLVGTTGSAGGMTPLVFQDAETIAAEGLTTPAFGTALSSTSGQSRERQIEVGARLDF